MSCDRMLVAEQLIMTRSYKRTHNAMCSGVGVDDDVSFLCNVTILVLAAGDDASVAGHELLSGTPIVEWFMALLSPFSPLKIRQLPSTCVCDMSKTDQQSLFIPNVMCTTPTDCFFCTRFKDVNFCGCQN